ncbi:MAG: hypothetical protein RQ885_06695 [Desulfurococcales archaeon]|nr:hypothetical protein [Desulfurococcales archaeon]
MDVMMRIALKALTNPMIVEIEPLILHQRVTPKTPAKRSFIELKIRIGGHILVCRDMNSYVTIYLPKEGCRKA